MACGQGERQPPLRSQPEYTSLLRLAESEARSTRGVELTTETLGGDSRTAFLLKAGQRLEQGPLTTGVGYRLLFGLASYGDAPDDASVVFRLAARHGEGPLLTRASRLRRTAPRCLAKRNATSNLMHLLDLLK